MTALRASKPKLGGARVAEVAVVIVNYRTPELTIRCVDALRREKEQLPALRVVVVDGGSADDSASKLADFIARSGLDWVSFLPLSTNGGFGWANNQAILELSRDRRPPDFIHLLNPDTEAIEGAVYALVEEFQRHPRCGAAGSQLLTPDGQRAASAFRFPSAGREFTGGAQSEKLGRVFGIEAAVVESEDSRNVDWVTGASVMFRAEALRETGLFDDGFFLYFEEVELMHRLHARGWSVRHVPQSRVIHVEGASTGIGAATAERPHPAYWYQSRRRYFSLTGGRSAAIAATLSLLGGKALAEIKNAAGRALASRACRTADLLRLGFWPSGRDSTPSAPSWGEPPGRPPAWMVR